MKVEKRYLLLPLTAQLEITESTHTIGLTIVLK